MFIYLTFNKREPLRYSDKYSDIWTNIPTSNIQTFQIGIQIQTFRFGIQTLSDRNAVLGFESV